MKIHGFNNSSKKADPISPIDNKVCRTVSAEDPITKKTEQKKTEERLWEIWRTKKPRIDKRRGTSFKQKLEIAQSFEVRSLGEQEFREDVLEIVDGGIWKAK